MEFKVIFMGFALHSVLNLVLISKTFITEKDVFGSESKVQASESQMLTQISAEENGPMVRISKSQDQALKNEK